MIKRAFVLFFFLAHLLVSPVISGRPAAACRLAMGTNSFLVYADEEYEASECFVIEDDILGKNETIIRADEFEWRESLTNMLLHRSATYRFLTAVTQASPQYTFTQIPKSIRESITLPVIARGIFMLPGYYGFLHRLCPF